MKYELKSLNQAPHVFIEPSWLAETLAYAVRAGWIPAKECAAMMPGVGIAPAEAYAPGTRIDADDAAALGEALLRWYADINYLQTRSSVETDSRYSSRRDFGEWLRAAGDVQITHGRAWAAERLAGVAQVKLVNTLNHALNLTPADFYALLDMAREGGWPAAGAGSDAAPAGSIFRPDVYDLPGAIIEPPDAGEIAAALQRAKPYLAQGYGPEMLPPALRTPAFFLALYEAGRHRGAGWIRILFE